MTIAPSTATAASPTEQAAQAPAAARPSFLPVSIREKGALYAAYMPFVANGGLFVPTTRPAHLGDSVFLMLSLVDDPNKLAVAGRVVWITPANTPGRQQGIGVQFPDDQGGAAARRRIEELLGGALKSARPTHTI